MISFEDFLSLSRFPKYYNQGWFTDSLMEVSDFDLQQITGYNLWVALGGASGLVVNAWDVETNYNTGDTVKYQNLFYRSLVTGNTGNVPSVSGADWVVAELYTVYYNYVRPFVAKAVAAKLVAIQGITVTEFALSIADATSGGAATAAERSKLILDYANSRDRYGRAISATLQNKQWTLDGVYYPHDRLSSPNRTMFFSV